MLGGLKPTINLRCGVSWGALPFTPSLLPIYFTAKI